MVQRQELYDRLVDRAVKDSRFRELLRLDPHSAIEEELGLYLPREITVKVLQDTDDTYHVLLPPIPEH